MQNNSLAESWFINDFHRKNSMAAQREVQQMSLHPCSREQKLAQIQRIKVHSAFGRSQKQLICNAQRSCPRMFISNQNMKRTIISIIYMLLMTLDICAQGAEFETAAEAVENMKVGWNLGNTLDAFTTEEWFHPTGWQDYETIWGNPITKPSLMRMMRKAGFNAIRIPVTWFPHMDTTGKIDEVWMKRVHEVVDYVIDQGMYCILNSHHDTSHKDAWLWADKSYYEVQERYKYMWTQIAQEFQYYDEHLLFAGWNEILERQEIFGGDSDKERYNVLNQINQDFVDAVRAVGGKNKSRNLIVAPYYNWCGWGKGTPDYIIKALQALTVPNDEFPGHILFEVHTYFNTSDDKISEVLDGIIEAINTYLVTKGVPVVIGEWGPSNEYDNPTRTDAFARHFMQETHSNRIATFAWNGPLCNGEYRNLPAFEEPSYICGIMKGYYGEEYEPQMLLKNDYDEKGQRIQFVYTIGYDGIGTELNVFEDDVPLKFKNYKGIRIEFAEPVSPDEFHFRFYGDGSDEDLRPVNNGQSTTIDFESLKFNQTINRITLQHTQEGKAEAKLICAWLIRHDGTEEYSDLSPFWGCEIKKIEDYVKPSALSYSYSVNEVIGDKIMRSTTGEESLGTELYVPYRRYNVLNGRLYQKMASGGPKGLEYNHYFTLTTDGQIENIDYEQTDITDVVFLSEAEDIPGMTLCDNDNMRVRSSNSAAAYAADGAVAFVTLPAGSYQLTAFIHDSYKNPDSNWSFLAGDREIANFHCDVVNIQEFHSDVFTLTKETTLYIPQNGGPRNGIDLIYITKQKQVTITANDLTMVYGDDVPTLTFKTEGDELNGTPSLSTTATKTSPVGTYPITVSQGSVMNSNVTYVGGTLTITKAPLTIKAGSYTKKQGEDNPVFALTYNGFKNKETRSVLTKKPTVTCEATKDSPPGDYEIIVSGAEAQNYDISYQSGWLKIEEAQGIQSVVIDGQPFDVYNIQGRKVRSGITTLKGLPKGVYIINGIKVVL